MLYSCLYGFFFFFFFKQKTAYEIGVRLVGSEMCIRDRLRKIAGLCNNANQLAHVANASGMASEQSVQEMLRLTKETWHLVKEEW